MIGERCVNGAMGAGDDKSCLKRECLAMMPIINRHRREVFACYWKRGKSPGHVIRLTDSPTRPRLITVAFLMDYAAGKNSCFDHVLFESAWVWGLTTDKQSFH